MTGLEFVLKSGTVAVRFVSLRGAFFLTKRKRRKDPEPPDCKAPVCGPFRAQNLMARFLASTAPWPVIAGQVLIVRVLCGCPLQGRQIVSRALWMPPSSTGAHQKPGSPGGVMGLHPVSRVNRAW